MQRNHQTNKTRVYNGNFYELDVSDRGKVQQTWRCIRLKDFFCQAVLITRHSLIAGERGIHTHRSLASGAPDMILPPAGESQNVSDAVKTHLADESEREEEDMEGEMTCTLDER